MTSLIASLTLISLISAVPCLAQTSTAQAAAPTGHASPQTLQALAALLQAPRVHHRYQTPQEKARVAAGRANINQLTRAGAEDLHTGNFVAAEDDYRDLIRANTLDPFAYYGLGESLAGQGKIAEAIAAYRTAVYCPLNRDKSREGGIIPPDAVPSDPKKPNLRGCCQIVDAVGWMKCALLLSQTGQAEEARNIYKEAFPFAADANHPGFLPSFERNTPDPVSFQAAVHIALGLLAYDDPDNAVSEFDQALQLRPDMPLTNYYYGFGWQHLDLKSKLRATEAPCAKAALQKAAASEDDGIKKAAAEALAAMEDAPQAPKKPA